MNHQHFVSTLDDYQQLILNQEHSITELRMEIQLLEYRLQALDIQQASKPANFFFHHDTENLLLSDEDESNSEMPSPTNSVMRADWLEKKLLKCEKALKVEKKEHKMLKREVKRQLIEQESNGMDQYELSQVMTENENLKVEV